MENKCSKNQEDSFLKNNNCIYKKFKPIQKIGYGSFGNVYLTKRIKDGKFFAMKVEKNNLKNKSLEAEAYFLYILQGFGIPKFISYGRNKNYNILIETLLDKSLIELMENRKKLSLKDVCLIGIQILERLEWIHSKNIIYRDIKPQNFLIGKDDPNVIYIIDFGLCKKYRSSKTGKHILPRKNEYIYGTIKYSSVHALSQKESSRRDDIISLGYMLIYLFKGSLPWDFEMKKFNIQIYKKILYLKKTNSNGTLFNNLPKEFAEYINYSNNLKFEQEPNYKYLCSLFKKILFGLKFDYKNMTFSWIPSKQIYLYSIPRNNYIKKSSSHSRLFKHIKKSLEKSEERVKNKSIELNSEITKRFLNNIPMHNIRAINSIKNGNNIYFTNKEEMMNVRKNDFDVPFKTKKIFKNKINISKFEGDRVRINNKSLTYTSNNSNNNSKIFQNGISLESIVNTNQNINNKNNLFNKIKNNIKKTKNNTKRKKVPINLMRYQHLNFNKEQNSFKDKFRNLNYINGTKINYLDSLDSYSNMNSTKDNKKYKINNINNSSFKNFVQKNNSEMILTKNQTNKKLYYHTPTLTNNNMPVEFLNSKISIDNSNNFELNNTSILQNKKLWNEKINIIYIKNKFNIIRNKKYKMPIPFLPFSNKSNINEERKYINLKKQNNFNKSAFSINNNIMNLKRNITYRSIFERYTEANPFSKELTPFFNKYFQNNL